MTSSPIADEIIRQLQGLSHPQQRLVLEFVSSLARPSGRPGHEVLHLVDTIDTQDLDAMRQVADEECEQIDPYAW